MVTYYDIHKHLAGSIVFINCNRCDYYADGSTQAGRLILATASEMEYCPGCGCTQCMNTYRKRDMNSLIDQNDKILWATGEETVELVFDCPRSYRASENILPDRRLKLYEITDKIKEFIKKEFPDLTVKEIDYM